MIKCYLSTRQWPKTAKKCLEIESIRLMFWSRFEAYSEYLVSR